MRAAVYAGTRNLYNNMVTAAKSLLIHSDVEKIYFLIEDDTFPYELPPKVECINVSNQPFFRKDGPNYNSSWTYMVLIRAALTKLFPNLDIILSLDVDTIVNQNINYLWDTRLDNYYLAAVKEPIKSTENFLAINMGVALFNLKFLRETHKDDEIIDALNNTFYEYNEQDCIAEKCQGHICELSPDYNVNNWCDFSQLKQRKIMHFAAVKDWQLLPIVKYYASIPMHKLQFNKLDDFSLDIIVPAYKDKKGLKRTLDSINYSVFRSWINITVVDDCSGEDYSDFIAAYPNINFLIMPQNKGPGAARNYGRRRTYSPYIMFIDCGDIILSKYSLYEIGDVLATNSVPEIYQWKWINGEFNTISGNNSTCTPGFIYKREFLDIYNIWFCEKHEGSYSNEDIGFNHTCLAICRYMDSYDHAAHFQQFETPIYKMIYNKDSLTHKNNNEFQLTKQIPGLLTNAYHCLEILKENYVKIDFILEEANLFMVGLYRDYLKCFNESVELAAEYFIQIRYFYITVYKMLAFHPLNEMYLSTAFRLSLKDISKLTTHPNIHRFFENLENNSMLNI